MDNSTEESLKFVRKYLFNKLSVLSFRGEISHRNRLKKSLEGTQDMFWQDKWLSDELWALPRVKQILTVEL